MRNTQGAIRRYSVGLVPTSFDQMVVFLTTELKNIESSVNTLADGYLELITVAPDKPREGMLRLAEAGVLGASKGVYCYYDSTWKVLG